VRRFEAPGIAFDYPSDWVDQTSIAGESAKLGQRRVAALTLGMSLCPGDEAPEPPASGPGGCVEEPFRLGELRFDVIENLSQYPGRWAVADSGGLDHGLAAQHFIFEGRDGGMYQATLRVRADESVERWVEVEAMVRALLRSVITEPWESPPPTTEGTVRQSTPFEFSFLYPVEWARYFPRPPWGDERAVVSVSSRVLDAPINCIPNSCLPYLLPPNTVVLELRLANSNSASYWRGARHTIGGQPAMRVAVEPWPPVLEDKVVVWRIRIPDHTLEVLVHMRGPDFKSARLAAQGVLESIEIEANASELR
jgi:hypothetical protein